jgi:hypothetical protein
MRERDARTTGNLILDALTEDDRTAVLGEAAHRPLPVGQVFLERGQPVEIVLFPIRGVLSLILEPDPDIAVEALTIGREGLSSAHAAFGSGVSTHTTMGQVEGEALSLAIGPFRDLVNAIPRLQQLVLGFMEAMFAQVAWNAACNAIHHVNARAARWLLSTHDRVDTDSFGLRQEFLATMLGVHRPAVSIAASALREAGCITYSRGTITIVDRASLEYAACPCYEGARSDYSRLVPLGN